MYMCKWTRMRKLQAPFGWEKNSQVCWAQESEEKMVTKFCLSVNIYLCIYKCTYM